MSKYYDLDTAMKSFKEDEIPIIIPTFNQVSYAKFMTSQLIELGIDNFVVSDNNSTYPEMTKWLDDISQNFRVLHLGHNLGPRIYSERGIVEYMPDYFIVTDPDLIFNKNLPKTFINDFMDVITFYDYAKIGFAMDIWGEASEKFFNANAVRFWEGRYWETPVAKMQDGSIIYQAPIDTTFALHNKNSLMKQLNSGQVTFSANSLRVAGNYTCEHMGWWEKQPLTDEEYEYYKSVQTWASTENEKRRMGL